MSDLTAAVLAAIAERRKVAEAATSGPWETLAMPRYSDLVIDDERGTWLLGTSLPADEAVFIAANDPTFALANLDAWEAVVRNHGPLSYQARTTCVVDCLQWPCTTVRAAARLFLTAEQQAECGSGEPVA